MAANFTLQNTFQFVAPWVNFYPLTVGDGNQPFMGMCERVAQILLGPPFKPSWNRNSIQFVTTSGTQTYVNAGSWASGTAYTVGTVIIDTNNNGQRVIVAGTSGGSAPSWVTGLFLTTTDNSVTWQNIGPLATIPQITDFAYIEKAAVRDIYSSSSISVANSWKEMEISLNLSRDTAQGCPKYVAAQSDDNIGDIAIRLTPTPGAAYPVDVQYQKLHQPFTALSNPWAPIPDRLFHTYSMGVLALAFLYKGDSRYQWASQQFIAGVVSYYGGLKETEMNQFLQAWDSTIADAVKAQKAQQVVSARGV